MPQHRLPAAKPTRRKPAPPWRRPRVTAMHPVRTERATVDLIELGNLRRNDNVRSIDLIGPAAQPRMVDVLVTWIDKGTSILPRRRLPFTIVGGGRLALVVAAVMGVPAVLVGAGWAVYALYGAQLAVALKLGVLAAVLVLAITAVAWAWTKSPAGCSGLHCQGCRYH